MSPRTDPEPAQELVITLKKPVQFGNQDYGQLVLREPTAGEWREILRKPAEDQQIYAVATISGVPTGAVERMGIGDVARAENFLLGFWKAAQATGG